LTIFKSGSRGEVVDRDGDVDGGFGDRGLDRGDDLGGVDVLADLGCEGRDCGGQAGDLRRQQDQAAVAVQQVGVGVGAGPVPLYAQSSKGVGMSSSSTGGWVWPFARATMPGKTTFLNCATRASPGQSVPP
jgi:hypothetical protein